MSDLLLEVPTDLALKRQTRSVFSAEEVSEEAERSLGGEEGGTEVMC